MKHQSKPIMEREAVLCDRTKIFWLNIFVSSASPARGRHGNCFVFFRNHTHRNEHLPYQVVMAKKCHSYTCSRKRVTWASCRGTGVCCTSISTATHMDTSTSVVVLEIGLGLKTTFFKGLVLVSKWTAFLLGLVSD